MASLMMMMGVLPMASQSLNLSSSSSSSSFSSQLSFSRNEGLGVSVVSTTTTPVSVSIPATSSPYTLPLIYCGRGDKKTAKGKRFKQSFGNARPKNKNKGRGPPRVAVPPGPPRKDEFEDDEIIEVDLDEDLFP